MYNKNVPALLGAFACALALPASAALYRCGNVFQDRPCEAQSQQEVVRPGRIAASAAQRPASAASAAAVAHPAPEPLPAVKGEDAAAVKALTASAAAPAPARKGPPSLACGNLREQRKAIESRLQAGGRKQTVEMYQRQMREVESNLADGNC